jgi:uncharacterized BrkB/YihY/UPF0761 family membrane protein
MMLMGRNEVFYGSLVIFPVALLLVYAFWIAVLFGAAFAFVHARLQGQTAPKFFMGSSGMLEDWRAAMRETQTLYLYDPNTGQKVPKPPPQPPREQNPI